MSCSICVCDLVQPSENGSTVEITALECKHAFHATCIEKALQSKGLCPVCRATVLLERTIKLQLGTPLDLEELRATQNTLTQSIRSETRVAVDALMKQCSAFSLRLKQQKEETEAYNEICDLLDEELKEKEAELQKSNHSLSKIRKKADVLDERRREFEQSPQDSLTIGYRNWLLNEDARKDERGIKAMGIAERSKDERLRFLRTGHSKIAQLVVNIKDTMKQHKKNEQLAKDAEELARQKQVHAEQTYNDLLAQARELGMEDVKSKRKKRAPDAYPSTTFDPDFASVDVSYDDDCPVETTFGGYQAEVFGYQHDVDMDAFDCDYGLPPSKTAKTDKSAPSIGVLEGGYISKVYSQNADKAPKKQRDFLRLFS